MDIFAPCYAFNEARLIKATGFYPYFHPLSSSDGPIVTVGGRTVIMLGSNNYLGLTHHPEVMKAAHDAIDRYGTGCTGSRFLNGNLDIHEQLETELASFLRKEDALVFSSGFLANCGTVGLLANTDGAVVFSANENHASLIDGTRMARRAEIRIYDGPADLARQLAEQPAWPHALVVTDAVFSMTGRVADLRAIVELKRQYGFRLYVDDAHGIGVLGPLREGTAASQGVDADVDLIFGTFSKSLASLGGFVAGEGQVIDYLRHKVRTFIFSAALPPASVAAALAALRVIRRDASLTAQLWEKVTFFRESLEAIGFYTMGSTTPIVPLLVGSESLALRMCCEALDMGIFTTPAIHPAVPYGQALIRTAVTPTHDWDHLKKGLEVFAALAKRYPVPRIVDGKLPVADQMDLTYLFGPVAPRGG
ncbi:MAG: pyridoxal phosphate-dependent aminotransferase family protein [Acidobacteria bacterium]|nr:pyridoxal phosphate-dependent aminotransferase family protein [Acidobacteriota bacterium]